MNPFIQQLINQKINNITPQELIMYANNYNISLSNHEAKEIIKILKSEKPINVTDHQQHYKIIKRVEKEISPQLAQKAKILLNQFSNSK